MQLIAFVTFFRLFSLFLVCDYRFLKIAAEEAAGRRLGQSCTSLRMFAIINTRTLILLFGFGVLA
jgi:hypothetical protein